MHRLVHSLAYLILFCSTFSTFANELLPRNGAPFTANCSCPASVQSTVTVTVSACVPGSPVITAFPHEPSNPIPIPPEYQSCFDRNSHSFKYSYSDNGYHFGAIGGSKNNGEPYTKSPESATASDAAHVTGLASSLYSTPKGLSASFTSTSQTIKAPYSVKYNSSSTSLSYPTASNSTSKANSTASALPTNPVTVSTNTTNGTCQPTLLLDGASEYTFNQKDQPFSVSIKGCSKFDVATTTAFANYAPIDGISVTPESINFPGFAADYVLLSIFALDSNGDTILHSYQLHFGSVAMSILVLGPDNQPAEGVEVLANATTYPGVGQQCLTDASGKCSLVNLPPTTIGLIARTDSNSIAVDGLATTTAQVTLKLLPFADPAGDSSFDVNNGTSGWTGGTISQSLKIKRDTTLTVGTNGQYTVQHAHNSFEVHPFTKTAYIKYKFITEEVPGGYFGTQYNDYYSVTIRSNTGAFVTVTNSMNALGLGAFDESGATDWFTLSLQVPANTKSVEYDIGVSNVADNLLDSSIVVDKVGDLQCDQCGDCSTCPSDPMCQSRCTDPPIKSCDFYRTCAEGQLGCGASGYPLAYGEKNCNKFVNNLNYFSSAGQNWIFGTMHCLQMAMVPVLKPCTATCSSFQTAAFNSHPGCYVDNGFCGLQCPDILAVLMTVGTDLFSLQSLKQAAQTAGLCLEHLIQTLSGCTGDIVIEGVEGVTLPGASLATKIALKVALALLQSAAGNFGS